MRATMAAVVQLARSIKLCSGGSHNPDDGRLDLDLVIIADLLIWFPGGTSKFSNSPSTGSPMVCFF
jgi:hypothetical protein